MSKTTRKKRMCILCGKNPAELPDRNAPGRPIKKICRECHAERLRRDLEYIVRLQKEEVNRHDA